MDDAAVKDALGKFDNTYFQYGGHNTDDEYFQFSRFIQGLFIDKRKWSFDKCSFQKTNYAIMYEIYYKIKRHPILWKLFFMLK